MMRSPFALLVVAGVSLLKAENLELFPDQPVKWEGELPARYQLTFEYEGASEQSKVAVYHDGCELLKSHAQSGQVQVLLNPEAGVFSTWLNGVQIANLEEYEGQGSSEKQDQWVAGVEESHQVLEMSGEFTVAARFQTTEKGTIFSKCAPRGKWEPDAKALFVKGGHLIYDIGWLGAIRSRSRVDDGKWHNVVLVYGSQKIRLFIDGKFEAERENFAAKDPKGSVFKIGDAAQDFGGPLNGKIGFVRFWKRALPDVELAALGQGEEQKTNTPLLNWSPRDLSPKKTQKGLYFVAQGDQTKVSKLRIEPIAEVDHARLISSLNQLSLERGSKIYNGLCITCHGNQEIEGSLPTALKFHQGEFKNGNDPYSLYQTLTKGYGLMVAQPWMTPRQKYDVIHYIRETFLKKDNPKQYKMLHADYLAKLPVGLGMGPDKVTMFGEKDLPKYQKMDFGPVLFWTLQVEEGNIAYKGIAIRLDEGSGGISKGNRWILYDHDTMRVAAAWTGDRFVDWRGIAFDQSHGTHTSIVGDLIFSNPVGPGWGRPSDGSFEEVRFRGRDHLPYGPLPRDWSHYQGLYLHDNQAVVQYTVGDTMIYETPGYEVLGNETIITRTLNLRRSSHELKLRIAPKDTSVVLRGEGKLSVENGFQVVTFAPSANPLRAKIFIGAVAQLELESLAKRSEGPMDLDQLLSGGKKRWPGLIATTGKMGESQSGFAVDEIELPWDARSPWNSWMRLGGFDFFADGQRAAVATWLGDVWIVDGLGGDFSNHHWQRIATGLFQPLGVKIVNETIYVSCRDQIAELNDQNGDGEIDYIRSFNNDHQVTEHFHEFAMGLQTDEDGNFYYAKSARHAKPALVEHHGTLLRVSADGKKTDILATGFRAANGVCLNPDGSFIVTDQEGHWNPKNRINWVKEGGFYGNMYGYHDVTDESDSAMEQPLCWITNRFDRSPGELIWVPENAKWGALKGSLLNLSYGTGKIFLVPHEKLEGGQVQGGMVSLGMDFPTGTMRGRFHPDDGQLYTSGMFAWAGNKKQDGGFYRIRKTDQSCVLPTGLNALQGGVLLTFTEPLDAEVCSKIDNYEIKVWDLKRTKNYGSKHYDEKALTIEGIDVRDRGRQVFIKISELAPTWGMEISYRLKTLSGEDVTGAIHNTIHTLGQ